MKRISLAILAALLAVVSTASAQSSFVACANKKTDKLVFRARCRANETRISTLAQLKGADGSEGADGSLRVYGDGSAGPLSLASTTSFTDQHVKQWTDCSVAAGITITVPSGTVLRCSGTFTNNGTITVASSQATQFGSLQNSSPTFPSIRPAGLAGAGWGRTQSSNGQAGDASSVLSGGAAGFSMTAAMARTILRPGPIGGGSGGTGLGAFGGSGGGSLTILSAGAFVNNGTIQANGEDGSASGAGGGAGGIIILASRTSFSQAATGTISAEGGDGATFSTSRGPGGGGGGGIIHVLAPTIADLGTQSVVAGAAGSGSATGGSVTASTRSGGGSGGSCAGAGGAGGDVNSNGSTGNASAGSTGLSLTTTSDPTSLF